MQIKYPENLNQHTCARIAHRCFGRDLVTENKSGFAVRPETKSDRFSLYTKNLKTLEKEGDNKFNDAYVYVKSYMQMAKMQSRLRTDGHINPKTNRYNPATGQMEGN